MRSESTLYRFLKREGLLKAGPPPAVDRRKFEAELPNDLRQSDALHGPLVMVGEKRRKTYLFAFIDDMSRLVPHAAFFLNENLDSYLCALRCALLKRGLPRKLYVDNGAAFQMARYFLNLWQIGVLDPQKGLWTVKPALEKIAYLRSQNARGCRILIKPLCIDHYLPADDIDRQTLLRRHCFPSGQWKPARMIVERGKGGRKGGDGRRFGKRKGGAFMKIEVNGIGNNCEISGDDPGTPVAASELIHERIPIPC